MSNSHGTKKGVKKEGRGLRHCKGRVGDWGCKGIAKRKKGRIREDTLRQDITRREEKKNKEKRREKKREQQLIKSQPQTALYHNFLSSLLTTAGTVGLYT